MALRASKPSFNVREKLTELGRRFGLKGSELAAAETVQEAREVVSAGRKNLIINGDMRISQRATSVTGAGSAFTYYTVDRIKNRNNGGNTSRYTQTQSTDSPSSEGFKYSFKVDVTTAKTTLNSNQYQGISQLIEGQSLQHLCFGTSNVKNLTLSFWVKSNTIGQYSCHISNWNNSRNISRPYTINTANAWEKKTITIPGDTTTAIPNDNGIGLEIGWCLATTSFYNDGTDGGVWHATSDAGKRHSGQVVEFGGTIGDTWYLAGVQLEVGKNATEFEHRSYGEELALCQRYYQNSYNQALGQYPGDTNNDNGMIHTCWSDGNSPFGMFPTLMRAVPSVTLRQRGTNNTGKVENSGSSKTASAQQISNQGVGYIAISSGTAGGWCAFTYELNAEL